MSENKELAEIKLVETILKTKRLVIPDYQRPYKWSLKHVNQLLDDLLVHMDQHVNRYRVGTVVLHQEAKKEGEEVLNIVDGQQRLVTFSLILYFLNGSNLGEKTGCVFLEEAFKSLKQNSISHTNLQNNYANIKQKLGYLEDEEKPKLKNFILKNCEFVVVTIDDISEAFQFFDSQNARGKNLEPYDLLKAFHLREMDGNTDDEKLSCVKLWEKTIENKELKPLFNEYLFRIRKWVRGESAFYFTKDDIDIFKGISPSKGCVYPYMQAPLMTDCFVKREKENIFSIVNGYPFQLDQVILNGKRFFEYVEHYRKLLKMVGKCDSEAFKVLDTYEGRGRTGDLYTRNLFQAALLYYVDRFGIVNMDQAVMTCFRWAYFIRLANKAVRLATMDNKALGPKSIFKVIPYALHPNVVLNYPYTVTTTYRATKVKKIADLYGNIEEVVSK